MIELGSARFFGPVEWEEFPTLREALETAKYLTDYNVAYPSAIRVDGVVRWERLPDANLNFRWRPLSG